jgi:hypothetical protein
MFAPVELFTHKSVYERRMHEIPVQIVVDFNMQLCEKLRNM